MKKIAYYIINQYINIHLLHDTKLFAHHSMSYTCTRKPQLKKKSFKNAAHLKLICTTYILNGTGLIRGAFLILINSCYIFAKQTKHFKWFVVYDESSYLIH